MEHLIIFTSFFEGTNYFVELFSVSCADFVSRTIYILNNYSLKSR